MRADAVEQEVRDALRPPLRAVRGARSSLANLPIPARARRPRLTPMAFKPGSSDSLEVWINLVLYQVGWFAVVLGLAWNHPWIGAGVGSAMVALDLALAPRLLWRGKVLLVAVLLGLVVESLNAALGVYRAKSGIIAQGLLPPPLLVLWAGFATTLDQGLRWLRGRYRLAFLLGGAAGPAAFFGGERLGAISLSRSPSLLGLLAAEWALALPLLAWAATRQAEQQHPAPRPDAPEAGGSSAGR